MQSLEPTNSHELETAAMPVSFPEPSKPQSVLICDSWVAVQSFIAKAVSSELGNDIQLKVVSDGKSALAHLTQYPVSLAILDTSIGPSGALPIAQELWRSDKTAKVMFVFPKFSLSEYWRITTKAPQDVLYGMITRAISAANLGHAIRSLVTFNNWYIEPSLRQPLGSAVKFGLTDAEMDTLYDLMLGLTDKAISERTFLSQRGIQSRLDSLYDKVINSEKIAARANLGFDVFNCRMRLIFRAMQASIIAPEELEFKEEKFQSWLEQDRGIVSKSWPQ
jgi:DNA-binding NarL/FixJ family response regulator